jgi:hypothetical protein
MPPEIIAAIVPRMAAGAGRCSSRDTMPKRKRRLRNQKNKPGCSAEPFSVPCLLELHGGKNHEEKEDPKKGKPENALVRCCGRHHTDQAYISKEAYAALTPRCLAVRIAAWPEAKTATVPTPWTEWAVPPTLP